MLQTYLRVAHNSEHRRLDDEMKSVSWIDDLEDHGWRDAEVIVARHLDYLGRLGVAAVQRLPLPHPNSEEKDLETELSIGNFTTLNALITVEADLFE